ncbi:hypothetical protein MTO96_035843 [Rhipicephalus appendiculatus]
METRYATAVVLEELPLYWDPRYKRYFYRGLMPSPTGTPALEALYATPVVEVVVSEDTPGATPIFVGRDAEGNRGRPSSGNRVRWIPGIPSPQRKEEAEEWDMPTSLFVFTALLLGLLIVLAALILWVVLSGDKDTSETTTWEGEEEDIDDFVG